MPTLKLNMGLDSKLTAIELNQNLLGTISFAVDTQKLYIDSQMPNGTIEKLPLDSNLSYGIKYPDGQKYEYNIKGTLGQYATAFGSNATASGNYSFAEGMNTIASGGQSHAEGSSTKALGGYCHAEGMTTKAEGNASHAEGYGSQAIGNYSHAEGCGGEARGNSSHAGGLQTIAAGEAQTAIGKYNKVDDTSLFIIGNGTGYSDSARSNALTVAQNGDLRVSGNIYTNNNLVVTKNEFDTQITTLNNSITQVSNTVNTNVQSQLNSLQTNLSNNYVLKTTLNNYALKTSLNDYALKTSLNDYATKKELNDATANIASNSTITNLQQQVNHMIYIGSTQPTNEYAEIWIDSKNAIPVLKAKIGGQWKTIGAVWS